MPFVFNKIDLIELPSRKISTGWAALDRIHSLLVHPEVTGGREIRMGPVL